MPAHDAIVGEYTLDVELLLSADTARPIQKRHKHKENIYLIFNPWCKEDSVYLSDQDERDEYVLNDHGRIFMGNSRHHYGRPWNFGQFEPISIRAAIYLLVKSPLEVFAHGNPVLVSRVLTAMSNSNSGDDGVLEGNWSGDYSRGTSPMKWNGSVKILERYMRYKLKVKYGQCWVYSGLVTTLCRALGIPTRSITNFESAHDTDGSLTVDRHIDSRGRPLGEMDDSVWNFHVWNECWFRRPDLPKGYDGWQVIDGTPQEESDDSMQCGPVPVKVIKEGNVYLGYDGRFVFAEVNGDRITWEVDDFGDLYPVGGEPHSIGQLISTKSVGSNTRQDLTEDYKHPEGTREEREVVARAIQYGSRTDKLKQVYEKEAKYDVRTGLGGEVAKSGDVEFIFRMVNKSSKRRTVRVDWNIHAKYNNGTPGSVIKEKVNRVVLSEKEEQEITWSLKSRDYLPRLDDDASLQVYALANVEETGQKKAHHESFDVQKPSLDLRVPSSAVRVGRPFDVTVSFSNPLGVSLTGGELRIEGAGLKRNKVKFRLPIRPGTEMNERVRVTPKYRGKKMREIIASFSSKQLSGVTGTAPISVTQ